MSQLDEKKIYNFIAQRDAQSSYNLSADTREISAASKRDSSAMKAIAVLTMTFLPSTFVAVFTPPVLPSLTASNQPCIMLKLPQALFSMPLFDWAAPPGTPVVSHRLRIYWAATIPLTVFVVAVWLIWLWITTRSNEAAYIKAREGGAKEMSKGLSAGRKRNPFGKMREK
jgi:hypothetical protein